MLMRKRSLLISVLAIFCIAAVWGAVFWQANRNDAKLQGKLVFAKTFDLGHKFNRIVITTAEGVTDLRQDDSYWRIENSGNYYADFWLMHQFLDTMNKSTYTIKLPYSEQVVRQRYLVNPEIEKEDSGLLIRTYFDDELLDEVIVGLPDENQMYFFARTLQRNDIWLINGAFNLPVLPQYWLVRPVLSVSPKTVEVVEIDEVSVQREIEGRPFYNNQRMMVSVEALLNVLGNVTATDVADEAQFKQKGFDALSLRNIKIVTFYGLEFNCRLYYNGEGRFWLNVKLSTTPLPMTGVNDYIRDNSFLYEGWYFELSPQQGHILRDFRLI